MFEINKLAILLNINIKNSSEILFIENLLMTNFYS